MTAGIIIARTYSVRPGIGVTHSGVRLKRKYGGPPWWEGINGISITIPNKGMGRTTVWIELWKRSGYSWLEDRRKRHTP